LAGQGEPNTLNSPETPLFEKGVSFTGPLSPPRHPLSKTPLWLKVIWMSSPSESAKRIEKTRVVHPATRLPRTKLLCMMDNSGFGFDGDKAGGVVWRGKNTRKSDCNWTVRDIRFYFFTCRGMIRIICVRRLVKMFYGGT
jgi:hypothetical protein